MTTATLETLSEQIASLTSMLQIVAAAPAIKAHVIQQKKVAAIRATAERIQNFSTSEPSERLATIANLSAHDRRDFLSSVGQPALTDLARELDDAGRKQLASFLEPTSRLKVACAISEIEVVRVQAGRARFDVPGLVIPAGEHRLLMRSDWNFFVDADPSLPAWIDRLGASVDPASHVDAAACREREADRDRLLLVGDGFELVPAVRIVDQSGFRGVVPAAAVAPAQSETAPEVEELDCSTPKGLAEYRRRQQAREDDRKSDSIARALARVLQPPAPAQPAGRARTGIDEARDALAVCVNLPGNQTATVQAIAERYALTDDQVNALLSELGGTAIEFSDAADADAVEEWDR